MLTLAATILIFFSILTSVLRDLLVSGQKELRLWKEARYLQCIFCIDYDDYQKLSLFGCVPRESPMCLGNACYMRQHKMSNYFLYTSGCLNLTHSQFNTITQATSAKEADRGGRGTETQLCEISSTINTCICVNRRSCNNVSSIEPFSEHSRSIFTDIDFNELSHFRYFLPNDPILKSDGSDQAAASEEKYFIVKGIISPHIISPTSSSSSSAYHETPMPAAVHLASVLAAGSLLPLLISVVP